jgi:release factor glutamine methyltransferase
MISSNQDQQTPLSDIWTVSRILAWSTQYLKDKGRDASTRLDVELILANAMQCRRLDLYLNMDKPLSVDERAAFRRDLQRRVLGEPVAYILGYRDFYKHRFAVDANVLIPRPETELLLEVMRALSLQPASILDVGTGSGALAVSLKLDYPGAVVDAWDNSEAALTVARSNAKALTADVNFSCRNVFDWPQHSQTFDVVISNPPYIAYGDPRVSYGTANFEPRDALFAGDGLDFYKFFAKHAPPFIRDVLICEFGQGQESAIGELFSASGWRDFTLYKDLAGINRCFSTRPPQI